MSANDGGPAFPVALDLIGEGDDVFNALKGMSLRAWFAGRALGGMLSNPYLTSPSTEETAKAAFILADAMIAQLNERNQ